MLGTRTRGGNMVGADESTELWRHPLQIYFNHLHMRISQRPGGPNKMKNSCVNLCNAAFEQSDWLLKIFINELTYQPNINTLENHYTALTPFCTMGTTLVP